MQSSSFIQDTYLPELGRGSGLAIWGFRACAMSGAGCCTIVRGFQHAFGKDGAPLLGQMLALARCIGHDGRRKVSLAMPGCARVTRDELSLLTVFSACQMQDDALRDAHLTWLTARSPGEAVSGLASDIASTLSVDGLDRNLPHKMRPRPGRAGTIRAITGGRA